MNLGIVGHAADKFTKETENRARDTIRRLLHMYNPNKVISGGCHLGGIDQWAVEEAQWESYPYKEYLPKSRSWEAGYKPRNIEIAENSDLVVCIVVRNYPPEYRGMRFTTCYHCHKSDHVKSGGCWTVKYAQKIGKKGEVVII